MHRAAPISLFLLFALESFALDQSEKALGQELVEFTQIAVDKQKICQSLISAVQKGSSHGVAKHLWHLKANNLASTDCVDDDGWTPLHHFVKNPQGLDASFYEIFTLLRYHGNARFDVKTKRGMTPLMLAVANNNQAAVFLLINHDQDSNSIKINELSNDGDTALHIAVMKNNVDIVKALLKADADLAIKDENNRTPRAVAKFFNFPRVVAVFDEVID